MVSVWGAVLVFNLVIHFAAPQQQQQYQYQSPYYLHFPPIPYNQIEINGPVSSNNIPPWLLQQSNLGIQNQTYNNQGGLPQVQPTVGTLRVQLPNPPGPYGNQIPQPYVLNNGSVMYYLSGPWGGVRNLGPINNNYIDNSIVTSTPANWQNLASVTPVANSGDFTVNRQQQQQQQPQQFSQFNPQQQYYQQQFNSLQGSQFPEQFGQNQQQLNPQQQLSQQQFNQGQQQPSAGIYNRDQGQPASQMETSSQNPNGGPVSWTQQGGWGWSAWDAWGPAPPVTSNPNSDGSSVPPGRGLLTRNRQQQSTTVAPPATTTNSSTTTNSIFAGATDSITKLRRIVSRIRDITREELGSQRRNATSRSLRRNSTARRPTTTTAASTTSK